PVISQQPVVSNAGSAEGKITSSNVEAKIVGSFLVVSLSDLREKHLIRFYDPEGKQTYPIIAYLASGGKLVTAMSVSENCRSDDFYLEGDNIHCAQCPSYWNASSMEAYACCQKYYPDPIPSTVLGDEIRIELASIRDWKARS
ncbi:MAG: DUF2318 domain-containing protein, partial [Ignavibacteriales bacterium]|nr:DUF2318 domain-containing protein [Ignavibacteriales bacterium]